MKVFCPNIRVHISGRYYLQLLLKTFFMVGDLSYIVVRKQFKLTFLSKIHPAFRNDANGFKPGSNSKRTDKHVAEYSKLRVCT